MFSVNGVDFNSVASVFVAYEEPALKEIGLAPSYAAGEEVTIQGEGLVPSAHARVSLDTGIGDRVFVAAASTETGLVFTMPKLNTTAEDMPAEGSTGEPALSPAEPVRNSDEDGASHGNAIAFQHTHTNLFQPHIHLLQATWNWTQIQPDFL